MEDIDKIRKNFRIYLNNKVEQGELSQVDADTQYSDADYPRKHALELDIDNYLDYFVNDNKYEILIKILQSNFNKNGKNPSTINSYKRALDNFKKFMQTKCFDQQTLNKFITLYKSALKNRWNDEKYKWQAVKCFQDNWNINSNNFIQMYQRSTELTYNLLNQGGIKRPIQMISDYCNEGFEDETKNAFQILFNENNNITQRINEFLSKIENINFNRNKLHDNANWSSYHDLNVACTYLWLMAPDKYYMYKYSVVKKITEILNYEYIPIRKTDSESNVINFTNNQQLYENIRQNIINDKELLNLVNNSLDENCYKDKGYYLLAQDLGYFIYQNELILNEEEESIMNNKNIVNDENISLNQILYGPPGTGKTYNTINYAVSTIENKSIDEIKNEDYQNVKERFNNYKTNHQIEFVTFHQSYSYEEFVEGIRPSISQWGTTQDIQDKDASTSQIKYCGKDGIFKIICDNAKKIETSSSANSINFNKTRIFKMSLGNTLDGNNDIFDYCVANNVVALGWGDDKDFSKAKNIEEYREIDSSWGSKAIEIFKDWMRIGDIILISNGNRNLRAIAKITSEYYYNPNSPIEYCQFRNVEWLYTGENIPVSKIYDKNFSQQSIYAFYDSKKEGQADYNTINTTVLNNIITGNINNEESKPYVLIIDEINRGNISKIFGELITLIEDDKRIGNGNSMTVTLPYSNEKFGVPNNLYIIGTMNTSDRSIASIDIALRRRFKFKEMMPKTDLVADFGCNFRKCFGIMNERISILLDRDHQIGHSYFIEDKHKNDTVDELKTIWFDSILPLFNEYFYGDWEKLQALLGTAKNDDSSFIKIIDNITFASDYSCDDDEKYDFNQNCDFVKAMKNAFGDNFEA